MAKQQYIAVLERGLNDSFGAFFPDLPGCVSSGRSAEEAMIGAEEALALHVEGMVEDGLPLPPPSSMHAFGASDFEGADVVSLFIVDVDVKAAPREAPTRINVSLLPSLIARVDAAADREGLTRSALLSVAARQWLNANQTRAKS
ncbi:MAG: type II toxin-antitoxin system HicB family antitoxin [Brevundimonas sp.]|uniref:type II toxin-antitoxin system HicB family antitoxin n=1 Tax=Brevundimonas sp. TaxID=1871086 RepID=UPI0040349EA7